MPKIVYGGRSFESGTASVLDTLTSHEISIPSSCRSGLCQACLMRAVKGRVPARAQLGLKPTLVSTHHFLACSCIPEEDMQIALPDDAMHTLFATVTRLERLNRNVLGIWLRPPESFDYVAGQFIRVYKDETTSRPYSLASVPSLDDELELHVRKVPGGQVSGWLFDELRAGDTVKISEAMGNCIYVPGQPEQSLLLIGTGSGLAPLICIAREALSKGHSGPIGIYHGSRNRGELYLVEQMRAMAKKHSNLIYVPCVSEGDALPDCASGMAPDVALAEHPDLSHWKVFLCGNADMVKSAKQKAFLAGASMRDIHADPF
jgi:ferredoxin-NADP reductase/ferredoxin